jgi:cytochrome c-type biogenesis protein CcmH
METDEEAKKSQIVESRARNISHNVRCTDCGSQSIEDSNADVAVLLRKVLIETFLNCEDLYSVQ